VEKTMRANLFPILMGLLCLTAAVPVSAHHGAAVYDEGKLVTVTGTVTAWVWSNPHCFLKVDVKDEAGKTAHWTIENQAPVNIANYGWSKLTFKPGDKVVVDVQPYRNLSDVNPAGRFSGRVIINGEVFKTSGR
jgi:hypothetical protein